MTPGRILLCIWLAFHLLTMVASMTKELPIGKAIRPLTDPYQWRVGVHQNWTMYAPNPRVSTVWVEFIGVYGDASTTPLPMFVGRPDTDAIIWRYMRAGKFERNAVSRKHLRASMVRWYCRTAKEEGKDLRKIRTETVTVITPPPEKHGPRSEWRETRSPLETWNCKR